MPEPPAYSMLPSTETTERTAWVEKNVVPIEIEVSTVGTLIVETRATTRWYVAAVDDGTLTMPTGAS